LHGEKTLVFLHGGWGKTAAAGSAQYAIDHWDPAAVVNLGTCGGLAGQTNPGEVILVEKTIVYDIIEQMGDAQEALDFYMTELDLSWLPTPYPQAVRIGSMFSADRDIVPGEVDGLIARGAQTGDWESGAIAWVCSRNKRRCLILRVVSDVVSPAGGEVYNDVSTYEERTQSLMTGLMDHLDDWLVNV
jgi:adenosylhomocysteine nucleosidase